MASRFYLTIPDPQKLADAAAFAFKSCGPEGLAEELQAALATDALFRRWATTQEEPDEIDPRLGGADPDTTVTGEQHDLHVDLMAKTSLNSDALRHRHRLRLLAGSHSQLNEVTG